MCVEFVRVEAQSFNNHQHVCLFIYFFVCLFTYLFIFCFYKYMHRRLSSERGICEGWAEIIQQSPECLFVYLFVYLSICCFYKYMYRRLSSSECGICEGRTQSFNNHQGPTALSLPLSNPTGFSTISLFSKLFSIQPILPERGVHHPSLFDFSFY